MEKFLIVTADDFGLHEAINAAVDEASVSGVLTTASLMVGAPACADAIARARALPGLRIGLHLVLADGWSVLPHRLIPALVNRQGRFPNRMFVEGLRYFALPAVRKQLEAEIRAQFEAFASSGLALDHVNAHKHFHLHPTLLEIILRVGTEFGLAAMRVPYEPPALAASGNTLWRGAAALLLAPWLALMRRRLRARDIACNDQVLGLAASGSLGEATLLHALAKLPRGTTEIYLHPALSASGPISSGMRKYRHADELAALLSPRVRAAMEATGASRGGYADLLRMRSQPQPGGSAAA